MAWCKGGQQAQSGDTCRVALLFKSVCSHFCFLLSPGWSRWLNQARGSSFSDLADLLLIPCLAAWKFWIREAGSGGVEWDQGLKAQKFLVNWSRLKMFFVIIFSLLPKRIFHIFPLDFDILGAYIFLL